MSEKTDNKNEEEATSETKPENAKKETPDIQDTITRFLSEVTRNKSSKGKDSVH